jgi:hypothetical protein
MTNRKVYNLNNHAERSELAERFGGEEMFRKHFAPAPDSNECVVWEADSGDYYISLSGPWIKNADVKSARSALTADSMLNYSFGFTCLPRSNLKDVNPGKSIGTDPVAELHWKKIGMWATLSDSDGNVLGSYNETWDNVIKVDITVNSYLNSMQIIGKKVSITYTVAGINNKGEHVVLEKDKVLSFKEQSTVYTSMTLNDPKNINTVQGDPIDILYNRDNRAYDYHYNGTLVDNNENMRTIIPLKGSIVLSDGYSFLNLATADEYHQYASADWNYPFNTLQYIRTSGIPEVLLCTMLGDPMSKEASQSDKEKLYADTLKECFTAASGSQTINFDLGNLKVSGFSITFEYDWFSNIATEGHGSDNHNQIVYLYANFPLLIQDKSSPSIWPDGKSVCSVYISSADANKLPVGVQYYRFIKDESKMFIPPIHIWWGCYAEDTLIRTLDGDKRADAVCLGDLIGVYGGDVLRVSSVTTGMDTKLYRIRTDGGLSIDVSAGHPMLERSPDGTINQVSAGDVQKGMMLLCGQGAPEQAVTEVEIIEYGRQVYNFSFEGEDDGNYLAANGFWSGDMFAQNKRVCRRLCT